MNIGANNMQHKNYKYHYFILQGLGFQKMYACLGALNNFLATYLGFHMYLNEKNCPGPGAARH